MNRGVHYVEFRVEGTRESTEAVLHRRDEHDLFPVRKNRIGVIGGPNGDTYMLTLDLGLCLHNGAFGEWEGQPATNELNGPRGVRSTIVRNSHSHYIAAVACHLGLRFLRAV